MKPNFQFEKPIWKKGCRLVIGVDEVGRGALAGPVVAAAVAFAGPGSSAILQLFAAKSLAFSGNDLAGFRSRRLRRGSLLAVKESSSGLPAREGRVISWDRMGIDDSKRLTAKKRQMLAKVIRQNAVWGIGEAGASYIDRYGIVKATQKAMRSAIKKVIKSLKTEGGILNLKSLNSSRIDRKLNKSKNQDQELLSSKFRNSVFVLVDAFHVRYVPGVGLKNQQAIVKGDQKSISIAAASIVAKVHRDRMMANYHKKNKRYVVYKWEENKGYGTKSHMAAIKKYGLTRMHRKSFAAGLII